MQKNEVVYANGQQEINLKDITQFFDKFYKKILIAGLSGLRVGAGNV